MACGSGQPKTEKKATRYTDDDIKERAHPRPGTHHCCRPTSQVVTLPMDNGWSKAIEVGKLPEGDERPVVVGMDPAADPVLSRAGKRDRRDVPVLLLQRNEIVSESRIAQIIKRVRRAAEEKAGVARQGTSSPTSRRGCGRPAGPSGSDSTPTREGWNKLICGGSLDPEEFTLELVSEPFPVRGHKRIAVKVVDVCGNESTVVREI